MKNKILLITLLFLLSTLKSQIVFQANEFYKFKVDSTLNLFDELHNNREIPLASGFANYTFTFDTIHNIVIVRNVNKSTTTYYPIIHRDFSDNSWIQVTTKSDKYGYCNYVIVDIPNVGKVLYNYWNEGQYYRGWETIVKIKNPTL